jgi:hypothetical protein
LVNFCRALCVCVNPSVAPGSKYYRDPLVRGDLIPESRLVGVRNEAHAIGDLCRIRFESPASSLRQRAKRRQVRHQLQQPGIQALAGRNTPARVVTLPRAWHVAGTHGRNETG